MTTVELLDTKLDNFLKETVTNNFVMVRLEGFDPDLSYIIDNINTLVFSAKKLEHQEYYLRKLIDNYTQLDIRNWQKKGYSSDINAIDRFDYKKSLLISELGLMLDSLGVPLSEEMFSREEFEELKSTLKDISQSIFDFQTRQEAANELIYNSVDEIRDELVKSAEKTKIFGTDFVKQHLAGKILDMTVKAGAVSGLNIISPEFPEVIKYIENLP